MGNINDHGAPSTSEQFENATPEFLTFIGIACFFCLLTIILGCYNVYKHIVVPLPSQLIYKTATLVVISSPMIMSVISLSCLFFAKATILLEQTQAVYEAFALLNFYIIIKCMLGGHRKMIEVLSSLPPRNYYGILVFKMCAFGVAPFKFNRKIIRKMKILVFQICAVRPMVFLLTVILLTFDKYQQGVANSSTGYIYLSVINGISLTLAMFALLVIFMATREILTAFTTTYKLLVLKLVFLLAVSQSFLFSILTRAGVIAPNAIFSNKDLSDQWLNWVLVVELGFISIVFLKAFPETDFALISKKGELHPSIEENLESIQSIVSRTKDVEFV